MGWLFLVGIEYSVNAPHVVTLPILFVAFSVNQSLPSGPTVIPRGLLPAVGIGYSVNVPLAGAIRPILFP